MVSLEGTDFHICEPKPFDAKWYSQKFKGPGLRLKMKSSLDSLETVVGDNGYGDDRCLRVGDVSSDEHKKHSRIQARHETWNGRLKNFFVLGHRFRHKIEFHSSCFLAVVNITQVVIENEKGLFSIEDEEQHSSSVGSICWCSMRGKGFSRIQSRLLAVTGSRSCFASVLISVRVIWSDQFIPLPSPLQKPLHSLLRLH